MTVNETNYPELTKYLSTYYAKGEVRTSPYYETFGVQELENIARTMTVEMFLGFCKGSVMKYRGRVGKKNNNIEEDLIKALDYEIIFDTYKHLCYNHNNQSKKVVNTANLRYAKAVTKSLNIITNTIINTYKEKVEKTPVVLTEANLTELHRLVVALKETLANIEE